MEIGGMEEEMSAQQLFQQQRKRSPRWSRIALVIVGGLALSFVGYVVVVIVAFAVADRPQPSVGDAMQATGQYYQAIQNHDYTRAFTYLGRNATITVDGRPVTMDSVNTLATTCQTLDTQDGPIASFTATHGTFEQGKNVVDLTMKVTRNGHAYDAHIKIELVGTNFKVGTNWKILHADNI